MSNLSAVSVNEPTVTRCLQSLIARWRIPAPANGPVEVTFPFVFSTSP